MAFDFAVLDTGSDDPLFSLPVAERIDAIFLPQAGAHTYRGKTYSIQYAYVQLELTDGSVLWSWPAVVGFRKPGFDILCWDRRDVWNSWMLRLKAWNGLPC